jgi:hypothetical protein
VKPHTWRVSMTVAVIASLLLGLAAVGLGVEDLRKINDVNHTINGIQSSISSLNVAVAVPSVTVADPTSGATVSGVVNLDAIPGENVSSVNFVASGGGSQKAQIAVGTLKSIGWVGTWDSTTVPNGSYQIFAVGANSSGKKVTSAGVTVTVKNPS